MSDSVRKSNRATKGQHTKNFEAKDTPTPKSRGKGKGSKAAKKASSEPTPPEEDEEDAIIRCICGYVEEDEDDDRKMIVCDSCEAWQHNECMEQSLDDNELPEQYFCEQCRPDLHRDLLAKIARGERPWEELAKRRQQEEEEKARRRKSKKGKKGRPSDIKPESKPEPKSTNGLPDHSPTTVTPTAAAVPETKAENVPKRKLSHDTPEEAKTPSQQEPQSKVRKVSESADSKQPMPAPRRKSSIVPTPTPTPGRTPLAKRDSKPTMMQMNLVENIADLQSDGRRKVAGALVKLFVEQTKQAQKEGVFTLPPNQSMEAFGNKLGLAVEYAVFMNFWGTAADPNAVYGDKFRTINHNVKQNSALRNRLLTGDLSPNDFSKMSSHDMASKDLQEKTAEMKRAADKQAVLVEEKGPRIRRTHKGEEFVETPETQGPIAPEAAFSAPARRARPAIESDAPQQESPEATSPQIPQAVELPDEVGTALASPKSAQPLSVDTKAAPRPGVGPERQSSNFNIQDVWSSVTGPDADAQKPRQTLQHTESGKAVTPPQAPGGSGDADIDRLLKDEDQEEEEPYSPTEYPSNPDAPIWHGKLSMQGVAELNGSGKHVAGANLSGTLPWAQLIPEPLKIEGRIDIDRASEYLCGLRWSQTTDVSVIAITPNDEEASKTAFDRLFQYFIDRKRYGVVEKSTVREVKDIYLVPVDAGASKRPEFIELLEYCTIPVPVPERMILITFVIRAHNSPTGGQENSTPRQMDTAAIASPVNSASAGGANTYQAPTPFPLASTPQGGGAYHNSPTPAPPPPQYHNSPPLQPHQTGFSPPHQNQQHPSYAMPPSLYHHPQKQQYTGPVGMDAAKQALGEEMAHATPTVAALLNEAPNAGVVEFQIVKELYETVPATRENFEMLIGMLTVKLQEGGQQGQQGQGQR
ncbi:MAG: hypothetical protein Q9222_002687 [Ikaeria aurantiellina]